MGMVPKYTNPNLRRTRELKTKGVMKRLQNRGTLCVTWEYGALAGAIREAATVEASPIAVL
jgi:hypothetical protein